MQRQSNNGTGAVSPLRQCSVACSPTNWITWARCTVAVVIRFSTGSPYVRQPTSHRVHNVRHIAGMRIMYVCPAPWKVNILSRQRMAHQTLNPVGA